MQKFDLIGALQTYCNTEGFVFLYGESFYQNFEASTHDYKNGQYILAADFNFSLNFGQNNKSNEITYSGVLMLGIKFDDDGTDAIEDDIDTPDIDEAMTFNDGTPSSLDETKLQKYTRRLLLLSQKLVEVIEDIACENELSITSVNGRYDLNKFDDNIDFVAVDITFIQ